jgi:shikimate kinase
MKTKTSSVKKTPVKKNKPVKNITNFPPVVLLGFMGAGKTVVAATLAEKLGSRWIDLDEILETTERKSINELFEKFGETVFREIESAALVEALAGKTIGVIALGGGTWTIEANRQAAQNNGFLSIWLDAPFELCWTRIKKEKAVRPLATKKTEARKLFNGRQKIYAESNLRIEIAETDLPETIADKIMQLVKAKK